jgi:hypothetical protein
MYSLTLVFETIDNTYTYVHTHVGIFRAINNTYGFKRDKNCTKIVITYDIDIRL